ncbi:FAD-dependent monooxygenase [Amycolatopsis sp. cmx-4-54]|uniref:FAD-dependent monooxygenase n=1 Tax=Amycolatopsis sp. cmx-4-54 TaxID=2790936 RepID=UPI00397B4DD1
MTHHAIIVGGGIAGSAAAIALRKAGVTAEVYEARHDGGDYSGAALRLPRNGLSALRALDAHDLVTDISYPVANTELSSGTGRHLGTVSFTGNGHNDVPRTMPRARLARVLRSTAADRGAAVTMNKRLIAATSRSGSVIATFDDGSTTEGTVLISADGLNSTTRRLTFPSAPEPRYAGTHLIYGYAPATTTVPPSPNAFHIYWGKKATFGYTSAAGDIYWYANIASPAPLAADVPRDIETWRERLIGLFRRDRTPATDVIRAADVILPSNARTLDTLQTWHTDHTILIGDAAHAVPPATEQGAALALEDAVVLAQALRDNDQTAAALEAFEATRRERVTRAGASRRSRTRHRRGTPRWLEQRNRDRRIAQAAQSGAMNPPAWLHDHQITWNEIPNDKAR